jgi:hydrogenase maturation protein HypF
LDQFARRLPGALPTAACLTSLVAEPSTPRGRDELLIVKEATAGPLAARVPEDRAICADCAREIDEPYDRRFRYPLSSCTRCGPRYTVIRAMPFEREETTMADFPLCVDCRHEYGRPRDRRFHAQTTTCSKCGPQVWCVAADGASQARGDNAIRLVAEKLGAGEIVAVRGLGGYQLLVDATHQEAIARLRERKGRLAKPLAVMIESLEAAERLAYFDATEREALVDPAAPIVLLRAKSDNGLAAAINPYLDAVGLMRPTTPLHQILARDFGRPLVCTSGNRDGEPLEFEADAAERRLAGIADAWLHHDREIARPIDDSVVRVIAGRRVTIRLARGLAPLALELPELPPTLAVGGYLKSAAAWSNGAQSVLGPHVGDQEALSARERFVEHLEDWQRLYRFEPAQLVHDLHLEYFSTQWSKQQLLPTLAVQHHHAHVVAGMLEHGWLDRRVLGVAWDGTGYGTDGTIWGGEFLEVKGVRHLFDGRGSTYDRGSKDKKVPDPLGFQRVARLRPFRLPGGEAAIHEPWRTAVAVCEQLSDPRWVGYRARPSWPEWEIEPDRITMIRQIADRPQLSPLTSSAGRLFDAAAALILGATHADFDGQAAMRLEAAADRTATGQYELPLGVGAPQELDWRPLFVQLLADLERGVDAGTMAMRFHRSLACGIIRVCRELPMLPVVLTGGVFQNRLLTELVAEYWDKSRQPLGLPGVIPPNDGGLAAGQLAIAAAKGSCSPCA